jgi:hypothetical protein
MQQDAVRCLRCRNYKLAANDRTLWRPRPDLGCSATGRMVSAKKKMVNCWYRSWNFSNRCQDSVALRG